MAATFALSGDLVVCVLAHLAVGAIGFIAGPALLARFKERIGPQVPTSRSPSATRLPKIEEQP